MDVLLSKKTAPKRRASLCLLFGSQKPTFAAALDEKPTRYYDFVDTPSPPKRPSPFISRQEISPELESKIRFSCSLLAYQIEQGIPSLTNNPASRCTVQDGPGESITTKAQIVSKTVKTDLASVTGYDSGVGLTQQPSMQTVRVLHSRSGDASDAGDTRAVSIFSNTRTGTSCSNTSAEPSYPQSSSRSPRTNELKSTTGITITGYRQPKHVHSTKAFLTGSSPALSEPPPDKEDIEDTNLFLNPTSPVTNLSSETLTLSSHPSPSLGLTRVPAAPQHPITTFASHVNPNSSLRKSRSIIIDSAGNAHLLTPDEEAQRNKALQHAVLSKMTPGFLKYNPIHEPLRLQGKQQTTVDSNICKTHHGHEGNSRSRQSRSGSWLGLSWTGIKAELHVLRRKGKGADTGPRRLRDQVPLIVKLRRLFARNGSE
ncbi:hypothetical protein BDW75DRAFT_236221 [Aspergillus navahoensis]